MNILVTGGCGFIFSNFIRYMINKYPNYNIINLDKLTYAANINNLRDIEKSQNYKFFRGDICDKILVEKIIKEENIDVIINGAAETHVDRSIIEAGSFVLTDIFGTYNLLETCRKFNIEKMVQISTDETYGHILDGSFREEDKLSPRNPYASSKAGADLLCQAYFETYNLPLMITRSTNNYGPNQHPEKFIAKTIIYTLLGRKIPVYGKGENVRDWIYVEDNCEAIDLVLHNGKVGEIYNIAGKKELQNLEVVKTILKLLGKDETLIEFVKDRPGHDLRYSLDIEKIRKLGWAPKTNFSDGIKQTVEWFQKNKSWWVPIISKQNIDLHKNF